MKVNILQKSFILAALLFSGLIFAVTETSANQEGTSTAATTAPTDPIVMLNGVTANVLNALKTNHVNKDTSPTILYSVVDKQILPYVDFNEMSVWVAGRTAWGKASPSSREAFIRQFKTLVVRTYATALNSYSNEIVEFVPQKVDTSKQRIQVSSWIKRANKSSIRVDYRLIKHGNSWLVYDMIVEGVSILQGFQAQFSDKIRKEGLDNVIAEIKQHNEKKEG